MVGLFKMDLMTEMTERPDSAIAQVKKQPTYDNIEIIMKYSWIF